jgi:threonine/homoserine/homoserine lactone efflux protein
MTAVQLMGVLFIAYLGISMISGGLKTLQYKKQDSGDTSNTTTKSHYFTHIRDGFFIVFFNPKIIIFFLAVFSQFLSAEQSPATQIAAATLAGALDAAWYALVAVMVSTGQIAKRIRAYAGHFDIGFGFLLCGVAGILVAQGI